MRKSQRRPSPGELQSTLELVRTRLAERGYLIAPVAKEHRKHKSDFLALYKVSPDAQLSNEFAIVRKAATCIVVRPFREARGNFYSMLPEIKRGCPALVRRGTPLLNFSRSGTNPWLHYVSDETHEELIALGCIVRPEAA